MSASDVTTERLIDSIRTQPGVYYVIGTLEQVQYLVKEKLALNYRVHFEPNSNELCSLVELYDPFMPSEEARIVVVDPKVLAQVRLNLANPSWVFLCTNEIHTDAAYPKLAKALDLKTTAVSKALKKHPQLKQIDLRKCPLSDIRGDLKEVYQHTPYTAERMRDYTPAEVEQMLSWTTEYGGANELLMRLLTADGVLSWSKLSFAEYLKLKNAYKKLGSDDKLAPISVKTTAIYITPFLQLTDRYASNWSYPLSIFAGWVWYCSTIWPEEYYEGLKLRISNKGNRYLSFNPSQQGIRQWAKTCRRFL